jgi:DNA-directed RNA polymerase specialized sigma subunit
MDKLHLYKLFNEIKVIDENINKKCINSFYYNISFIFNQIIKKIDERNKLIKEFNLIKKNVDTMNYINRKIFYLYYIKLYDINKIAKELNLSERTIFRKLKKIKGEIYG